MKIIIDKSPNYTKKPRFKKDIRFVIIHYTGMQSTIESIERLKDIKSKVSCHYLINKKGNIVQMVQENKIAWHAGKSKWKNFRNLNKNSIGIELVNKGHEFGYENFPILQINSLITLCKKLKKKYRILDENFLGHSDIAPLRKIDPGEKFPWRKLSKFQLGTWYKVSKKNFNFIEKKKIENSFFKNLFKIGYRYFAVNKRIKKDLLIIRAFQKHYLPQSVTGKIDKKTFRISHYLASYQKK
jgi:N-acetylmuramoyl-L-alanine amidase